LLAALARAAEPYDIALARELIHQAVEIMNRTGASKDIYETLAKLDPETTRKLVVENKIRFPSSFIWAVASVQPELAWMTLKTLDETQKAFIASPAALAREFVPYLPDSLKTEAQEYLLSFLHSLPEPWKPKFRIGGFGGLNREELRRFAIISDIIVSLGSIDPDTALAQLQQVSFSEYLDKRTILEPKNIYKLFTPSVSGFNPDDEEARDKFAENFFKNLVRLDLALSLLNQNPKFSLAILDSLKNDFWIGLSYTSLKRGLNKMSGFDPETEPNPIGFKSRLRNLLKQAKEKWPVAAVNNNAIQAEDSITKQYRFIKVAELFDRAAIAIFVNNEDSRKDWLNYLPFALVDAGRALYTKDSTATMNALKKAMNWISQMPTPACEWALSWNTAAVNKFDTQMSLEYEKATSLLLDALMKNEPWEDAVPLLVKQVAVFNPDAALKVARREKDESAKIRALLAVVYGMNF